MLSSLARWHYNTRNQRDAVVGVGRASTRFFAHPSAGFGSRWRDCSLTDMCLDQWWRRNSRLTGRKGLSQERCRRFWRAWNRKWSVFWVKASEKVILKQHWVGVGSSLLWTECLRDQVAISTQWIIGYKTHKSTKWSGLQRWWRAWNPAQDESHEAETRLLQWTLYLLSRLTTALSIWRDEKWINLKVWTFPKMRALKKAKAERVSLGTKSCLPKISNWDQKWQISER